jgi:large subunit ribosomal protein L24
MLSAHLSKELRLQYKRRSFPLRVGDEVRVAVGEHAGKTGKVTKVDLSSLKVYIGIKRKKVSGQEVEIPFDPSNLIITKLNLEDKKRERALRKLKKVNKDGKA